VTSRWSLTGVLMRPVAFGWGGEVCHRTGRIYSRKFGDGVKSFPARLRLDWEYSQLRVGRGEPCLLALHPRFTGGRGRGNGARRGFIRINGAAWRPSTLHAMGLWPWAAKLCGLVQTVQVRPPPRPVNCTYLLRRPAGIIIYSLGESSRRTRNPTSFISRAIRDHSGEPRHAGPKGSAPVDVVHAPTR